ncbi:MAG: hypothetical protein R8G34_08395 [Paracoccaceae bacterium]|nr:hypothetical protein [Paracoccaceae bacterium]
MANQSTHMGGESGRILRNAFASACGFLKSIGSGLLISSAYTVRVQNFQALHAKSDEQLAALDIKRDDIVHLVFQDLYYA